MTTTFDGLKQKLKESFGKHDSWVLTQQNPTDRSKAISVTDMDISSMYWTVINTVPRSRCWIGVRVSSRAEFLEYAAQCENLNREKNLKGPPYTPRVVMVKRKFLFPLSMSVRKKLRDARMKLIKTDRSSKPYFKKRISKRVSVFS